MPGMMETVLNIGLNDESVQGLGGPERRRPVRDGLLPSAAADVRLHGAGHRGRGVLPRARRAQEEPRHHRGHRPRGRRPARARGVVQEADRGARRPAVPPGPPRADGPRRARGLRLVEHRARGAVPPPGADPGGPRDGRQHPGDGLRQPRPDLGLGRLLHPRPGVGSAGRVRRLPAERPGRGRRRRHPQHGLARGPRRDRQGGARRAARDHAEARAALPRHVRHRVHDRARQAVDAADPGRQADPRGGVPDRGPDGRGGADRPRRGAGPGHRRPAGPADVPALRREGGPRAASRPA